MRELEPETALPQASQKLLNKIGEFYGGAPPNVYRSLASQPNRLRAAWAYAEGVLPDRSLSRMMKTMLGFAASVVSRSPYGIQLHRREILRLGAGEDGLHEVLGIIQLFEAITRVADLLLMPAEIENKDMPGASSVRQGGHTHGVD